jgi:hypothetical protein
MDQRTTNYLARRIGIIEDKINELFSPSLNEFMDIYIDYCDESFVNLICELLKQEIVKDIPLDDNFSFSNLVLYNSVSEHIKSTYQLRIIDYYNSRKTYL